MDLALGVMKAARARPAVGATEDRAVRVPGFYARQLFGDEVECLLPRHFDERLLSALVAARAGAMLEPALAHRRAAYAQPRHLVRQHVQADRRGVGILREGVQPDWLALVVVLDLVDAPVGGGERTLMSHCPASQAPFATARNLSTAAGSVSKAVTSRKARSPGRSDGQGWYCAPASCR